MTLLAELQRRKVFKVGAAYLVVAWLAVQAVSIAFPAFDAPVWALRVFILLTMLGFPVVMVLTWVIDLTPEGVKFDPDASSSKGVFAGAALLIALALGWYYYGQPSFRKGDVATPTATNARSIAVLPFVNMSGDKDNEYFSDGISEEILNVLARTPELLVAARTSSFSFKDGKKEVPEIARELKVRMVLEGSVRKQGERVRITAQLIDASNGYHVWSQTYDRDLKDIFAIQDEIAQAIASELKVKLAGAPAGAAPTRETSDLVAYDLYLKGLALWQARGVTNLRAAETNFRAALARDPDFAKAWAGLALTYNILPDWSDAPRSASYAIANDAAQHALALDRDLPEPYAVLGDIAYDEFRYSTGRAMFKRAIALAPSYATAYQWFGNSLTQVGDLDEAIAMGRKSVALDPKSAILRSSLADNLFTSGQDDESWTVCASVLAEQPDWHDCHNVQYDIALARKDYAAARTILEQLAKPRGPEALRFAQNMNDALEGKGDANAVAERLVALPDGFRNVSSLTPLSATEVVHWLLVIDREDLAVERYDRYAHEDSRAAPILAFDTHLAIMHCNPKFLDVLRYLKIEEPHLAAVCPRVRP